MLKDLMSAGKGLLKAGASVLEANIKELSERISMTNPIESSNTIVLTKGVNISLEKEIQENGLEEVCIGLAWDEIQGRGEFDADSVALMLDGNGKLVADGAVYYRLAPRSGAPFQSKDGSIKHSGDNLTGKGSGDDETLTVVLSQVPSHVEKIEVIVNIHEAAARGQNFGQVPSCKARIYNKKTNDVLAKYDLVEDFSGATAVHAVQLYRYESSWKFKAIGAPLTGNLAEIVAKYQ